MKTTMAIVALLLGLGALASCGGSAPATPADREEVETLLADAEGPDDLRALEPVLTEMGVEGLPILLELLEDLRREESELVAVASHGGAGVGDPSFDAALRVGWKRMALAAARDRIVAESGGAASWVSCSACDGEGSLAGRFPGDRPECSRCEGSGRVVSIR